MEKNIEEKVLPVEEEVDKPKHGVGTANKEEIGTIKTKIDPIEREQQLNMNLDSSSIPTLSNPQIIAADRSLTQPNQPEQGSTLKLAPELEAVVSQLLSRTYRDGETIAHLAPRGFDSDFAKIAGRTHMFQPSSLEPVGNYPVELLPLPVNVSPFKELGVSENERSVLYGARVCPIYSNAIMAIFHLPNTGLSVTPHDQSNPAGHITHQHVAAVTILQHNLAGTPTEDVNFPIFASPHPAATASYIHQVMDRRANDAIDLRFKIVASDSGRMVEDYTLGRVWVPLHHCSIHFPLNGDNYDAVEPQISAAFDMLKNPALFQPKDIGAFTTAFRFAESVDTASAHAIYSTLRLIRNHKLSLTRLYWRIWCAIFEAMYWEERGEIWRVDKIRAKFMPSQISGPVGLIDVVDSVTRGRSPFFVSEQMRDELQHCDVLQYLYFLLCAGYEARTHFGISTVWPDIEETQLCFVAKKNEQVLLVERMPVRSNVLYSILQWLAQATGQLQFIEEVGRTVACFLMRPEGDSTFSGHHEIAIPLPKFRSSKTILFMWPIEMMPYPYEPSELPLYKVQWIGIIHYLMMTLAINTVLAEKQVFTALQLLHNKVSLPDRWFNNINRLFENRNRSTLLISLAQRVALRCGWGQIFNRILCRITISEPDLLLFTTIPQWADWFLFQRIGTQQSWLMAMMSHFSISEDLNLHQLYCPEHSNNVLLGRELFYRLDTMALGTVSILHGSLREPSQVYRDMAAIAAVSGLPLDGQYSDICVDESNWYKWVYAIDTIYSSNVVRQGWEKRKKYTWEVYSPSLLLSASQMLGIDDYEPPRVRKILPSFEETLAGTGQTGVSISQLISQDGMPGGVIHYGMPNLLQRLKSAFKTNNNEEDCSQTGSTSKQTMLEGYKPDAVATTLHYCEPQRRPTYGEYALMKRAVDKSRDCYADGRTHKQSFKNMKSVSALSMQRQLKIADRCKGAPQHYEEITNQTLFVEEAIEHFEARQPPTTKDVSPVPRTPVRLIKPELKSKVNQIYEQLRKSIITFVRAYPEHAELKELVKSDMIYNYIKSVAVLNPSQPQFESMAAKRVLEIFPKIEQVHYINWISKYPMPTRAAYCRSILEVLPTLVPFIGGGTYPVEMYQHIMNDFTRMATTFTQYPQLTQEEWDALLPNQNADDLLRLVLGTNGPERLEALLFGLPVPDEEKELDFDLDRILDEAIALDVRSLFIAEKATKAWTVKISITPFVTTWAEKQGRPQVPVAYEQWQEGLICRQGKRTHTNKGVWLSCSKLIAQFAAVVQWPKVNRRTEPDEFEITICDQINIAQHSRQQHQGEQPGFPHTSAPIEKRLKRDMTTNSDYTHNLYFSLFDKLFHDFEPSLQQYLYVNWNDMLTRIATADWPKPWKVRYSPQCSSSCMHDDSTLRCYSDDWHTICPLVFAMSRQALGIWASMGIPISKMIFDSDHNPYIEVPAQELYTTMVRLENAGRQQAYWELSMRASLATVPAEIRLHYCPNDITYGDLADAAVLRHVCTGQCLTNLRTYSSYAKPAKGIAQIFQIHAVYVVETLPDRSAVYCQVKQANPEMCDFELGAVFMWWGLMPEEVFAHIHSTGLQAVNLNKESKALAQRSEIIRQQGAGCTCKLGPEIMQWFRKFVNLKGRDLGFCDVDLEEYRHRSSYSVRMLAGPNGATTRLNYIHKFLAIARKLCLQLVARTKDSKLESIQDWWSMRLHNTPSGSSSLRHLFDQLHQAEPRLRSNDRPNKKAVAEFLPDEFLIHAFQTWPCSLARRSTKYEPGRKHRALYAADDLSTLVAAYASQEMEKQMNFDGMCPQQRPADVLAWWKVHDYSLQYGRSHYVWLSADYTDFNKEHSQVELQILNICIAKAWLQLYKHRVVGLQKARASMWVAQMLARRLVVCSDTGAAFPVFSALWSGSRDTARDNTLMHNVYHNIILDYASLELNADLKPVKVFMCGDDEDALFAKHSQAMFYFLALKHLGWHTNDVKQMCGFAQHEFLQKMPSEQHGARGPVTAMICAMASGQWYKTPGMHQDCAIACISDQLWELVVRGAALERVLRLGYRVLNAYMRVADFEHPENGHIKLEWLEMRLSETTVPDKYGAYRGPLFAKGPPLWHGTEAAHTLKVAPGSFYEAQHAGQLPTRASQAWCSRFYHLFDKYGKTDEFGGYVAECASESYGAYFHSYLQEQKQRAMLNWPLRSSTQADFERVITSRLEQHQKDLHDLEANRTLIRHILLSDGTKALPLTDAQLLGAVGADLTMFRILGGWSNAQLVEDLQLRRKMKRPAIKWTELYPNIKSCVNLLDPAIRSFLLSCGPN